MREQIKACARWIGGAGLIVGLLATPLSAKEMSDQSVQKWMDYAWSQTPNRFTMTTGETIEIDKKKKDDVIIPIDVARQIIAVAHRSYRAQMCDLKQEQSENYFSLVARETAKKKWSKQQGVYIMMLHLTVVQLMTGKAKLVEKDGDKVIVEEEVKSDSIKPCTDAERAQVKEQITAYVKSGPAIAQAPVTDPAAAAPAPAAAAAKK